MKLINKRSLSFNIRGNHFEWDRPLVMGILNMTADSFYEKSRVQSVSDLLEQSRAMLLDGADILDLGAQSTRPGAKRISAEDELSQLIPGLQALRKEFPGALISVDTFYADAAEKAVENGADIINDISAGTIDSRMFSSVAKLNVPYILMHMQGEPSTMHRSPVYADVVGEVMEFIKLKIRQLNDLGIKQIVLDPGFGFGKTSHHNLILLKNLERFCEFGLPVMVGLSRKKTIQNILEVDSEHALNGTTVMNTLSLVNGASILRVHDVKEAVEAVKLVMAMERSEK